MDKNVLLDALSEIITEADTMRGAYFYNPPCHASERRAYEKRHSHPMIAWNEGGHAFTAEYSVACSCRNVYAKGTYTRDGSKTTLTAIKNSFNRMVASEGAGR